jgi:hypothetical protein
VGEDVLEQARVDLTVPPGTGLREQRDECRRLTAAAPRTLDRDQPAGDEVLSRLEVAAAPEAGARRGGRVSRERAFLAIGEARERQRDEPLAHR